MNGVRFIKYVLPPVLIDLLRRFRPPPRVGPPEWEYLPEGWKDGDEDAQGWNVESVAGAQRAKWQRFVELAGGNGPLGISHEAASPNNDDFAAHATIMSFGYVAAHAARHTDSLSILDWGGGVGHYGVLARALLPGVTIDYHCKDMPMLCAAGRDLQPDATYHEDEESCFSRSYDLVMASGSMHYSRNWREALGALAAASRGWLYITRFPVVKQAPSFVVLQRPYMHGYDTEYCGWFVNRTEFLDHAASLGLELVREFLVAESPPVAGAPERCQYGGFLFRASTSNRNHD
jgi:putative methyltransferase (TIGR04325 family)